MFCCRNLFNFSRYFSAETGLFFKCHAGKIFRPTWPTTNCPSTNYTSLREVHSWAQGPGSGTILYSVFFSTVIRFILTVYEGARVRSSCYSVSRSVKPPELLIRRPDSTEETPDNSKLNNNFSNLRFTQILVPHISVLQTGPPVNSIAILI